MSREFTAEGMKGKRLEPGKAFLGPEPRGCFNSGFAPVIYRSKLGRGYFVGFEVAIIAAARQSRGEPRRRVFDIEGRRVERFATRGPAMTAYAALVNERLRENEEERREVAVLAKKAVAGDMGAVLALGNY